jgi:hypothetical protein
MTAEPHPEKLSDMRHVIRRLVRMIALHIDPDVTVEKINLSELRQQTKEREHP